MTYQAHILVIDDEPGIRNLMGFELGECGYHVVEAVNGTEALMHLEREEFDICITDLKMPVMNGIDLLKTAKTIAPDMDVIVVTGHAELENAIECLRAGAFDLIQKPFLLEDFLSSVKRAIEHRRLRITAKLYEACQEILGGNRRVHLFERIAATTTKVLGTNDISLILLDNNNCLRIVYTLGGSDDAQAEIGLMLAERVVGQSTIDHSPAVLPDALSSDPRFTGIQHCGNIRSGIIYPLCIRDLVLGVITLNRINSPRRFRTADLEAAGIVATQAAFAIHNEKLVQNLVMSERLATIGQVAAGIVHEINNPLNYIKGNADFLRDIFRSVPRDALGQYLISKDLSQEIEQSIEDMQIGTVRLSAIVADMRRLSREEQEWKERFDMNAAIGSAIRIARPALRSVSVVTTEISDDLTVVGSPGQMSQVILNLLVNAAQAIESAAKTDGKIIVRSRQEAKQVLIDVIDNGPGIPPNLLSRIMEPFFTTKSGDKGNGLGLSISREIVEHHGGTIRVISEADRQTIFTVSIPIAPPLDD